MTHDQDLSRSRNSLVVYVGLSSLGGHIDNDADVTLVFVKLGLRTWPDTSQSPTSAPSRGLRSARECFPQSGGQRPSAESPGPRGQSTGWAAGARRPDTPSITDTRYN